MDLQKHLFLTVITATLLTSYSCKKSGDGNNNIKLEGVYHAYNTLNFGGIRMYTERGQVTNQGTIDAYIKRRNFQPNDDSFFSSAISIPRDNSDLLATFEDNGKVIFSASKVSTVPTEYTITQRSSTGFILEAVDTAQYPRNTIGISRSQMLIDNANAVSTFSNCRTISLNSGYDKLCTFRAAYPFIIKNGQLYLALLSCYVNSRSSSGLSSNFIGNLPGLFNSAIITQLSTGDTLVYQSRTILLSNK